MGNYFDKLLSIAGEPLADCPPILDQAILNLAGNLGEKLASLLTQKNGFYCFESALHIFPSGSSTHDISLESWNSQQLWRKDYGSLAEKGLFFAEDIFGVQFCILNNKIVTFDPETGDTELIANNLENWAKCILDDYEFLTGFSFAHSWQQRYGAIPPGKRLLPKIPFVLGGEFEIENLYVLDSIKGMQFRADLARQIKDNPDGTKIKFKIVD